MTRSSRPARVPSPTSPATRPLPGRTTPVRSSPSSHRAPSTSSVPRRRPTPFARACRVSPFIRTSSCVHRMAQRSPRWSDPVHPTRLRGARHRAGERDAQHDWGRRARRGAPADVPYRRPSAGSIGRFDASRQVWAARLRKSAWEIERMRTACDILDRAFADLHAALRPGMSERDIHNILAAASFAHGAHRLGYTMVVAGVERGLFGDPTERRWQKGEVLFVDGGVVVDGYWADYCRMYTVGAPTPSQRDDYARAASCSRCRPGARCCPHREQSWPRDRFGAGPASRQCRVRSFWSRHRTLHAGAALAPPG